MIKRVMLVFILLFLTACNEDAGEDPETLLPVMDDYNTLEGESLVDALTKAGLVLSLMNPVTAGLIVAVDRYMGCAQDIGAADFRLYSNKEFPESAGAAIIINQDRMATTRFFLACVVEGDADLAARPEIQPCSDSWQYTDEEATYWMIYAGTTQEICNDFSARLPR